MRVECECGGSYTHNNMRNHIRTRKHKHYEQTGIVFKRKSNVENYLKWRYKDAETLELDRKRQRDYVRERIKKYGRTYCPCGGYYLITNRSNHFKSKKHQQYMKSIE